MDNKKNSFIKFIMWLNIISWITAYVSIMVIDRARPPFESFFNRLKNMPLRKTWDGNIMHYAFYLLCFLFILCILSIILNIIAYKKNAYKFRFTPFFLSLCSLAGIVAYFIYF